MKPQLITPNYAALLKEKHYGKGRPKWGNTGHKFAADVRVLAKEVGAKTILDYGCGRGTLAKDPLVRRFRFYGYDPAVVGKRTLPRAADVVTCIDVLEHVEPKCIDTVLGHIFALTRKACFASICMRIADNWLPDGRNAHLIIQPLDWWLARFDRHRWSAVEVQAADDEDCVLVARK